MSVHKINLFDNLGYKEAKEKVEGWVIDIKSIEKKVLGKLILHGYVFQGDSLIDKISAVRRSVRVTTTSQTEIVQTSRLNYEEEEMINFIDDKDEMKMTVELFIDILNDFDKDYRMIIYHLFYKRCTTVALSHKLNIPIGTLEKMKHKSVIEVAEALELQRLIYRLSA